MTDNEEHLKAAAALADEFESELEAERLREAVMALDDVILADEPDAAIRTKLRALSLVSWLRLLAIFDRHLDPDFDPNDVPDKLVSPPDTADGGSLRPGASPSDIEDPVQRAAYEKAIADNRTKAVQYRLQTHLHRLKERLPARAEAFIRSFYASNDQDRESARGAIEQRIVNPARKTKLLKLLTPPT